MIEKAIELLKKNRKFANYLIFPRFQLTLIFTNLFVMTLCYGFVFFQIYDSFHEIHILGERLRLAENSPFFKVMDYHHEKIQNRLIITAIISYILTFMITLKISHKVSGPLYRLQMYFTDLSKNGLTHDLEFRQGDYYEDLPEKINSGLRKVKES